VLDRLAGGARPANYGTHLFYALLLVAGAVAAYIAGRNSSGGEAHTRLGIAGAAVLVLLAYVLVRHVHPPRLHGLALTVAPEQVEPGGALTVTAERTRGPARGVQVGLVGTEIWTRRSTDHKGRPMSVERTNVRYEDWRELPEAGATLRVEIPPYAQPTSRGRGTRVFWTVVARRPRRLWYDPRVVRVVKVGH
jgi:uncharacterized membrane protein YeaQ/YmgE (transglycosylase-associated protein family)